MPAKASSSTSSQSSSSQSDPRATDPRIQSLQKDVSGTAGVAAITPLQLDQAARELLAGHRVLGAAEALGLGDDLVVLAAELGVLPDARGAALEGEQQHRGAPALADLAQAVLRGHARVGEEDLAELARAAHLRGDEAKLLALEGHPDDRGYVVYRDSLVVKQEAEGPRAMLSINEALQFGANPGTIFLGLRDGAAAVVS